MEIRDWRSCVNCRYNRKLTGNCRNAHQEEQYDKPVLKEGICDGYQVRWDNNFPN